MKRPTTRAGVARMLHDRPRPRQSARIRRGVVRHRRGRLARVGGLPDAPRARRYPSALRGRPLAVLVLALSGCAVVDALDGDLEDQDSCCLYWPAGDERVNRCVRELLDADECASVTCGPPGAEPRWVCFDPALEADAWELLGDP